MFPAFLTWSISVCIIWNWTDLIRHTASCFCCNHLLFVCKHDGRIDGRRHQLNHNSGPFWYSRKNEFWIMAEESYSVTVLVAVIMKVCVVISLCLSRVGIRGTFSDRQMRVAWPVVKSHVNEWVITYYEISHTQTVDVTMSTEFNQCWGCFWPLPAHCALSVVKVKLKWHLLNFMSHAQLQVCLFKKNPFCFWRLRAPQRVRGLFRNGT